VPATVRILAALTPERRQELETLLQVLQADGYSVTIHPDGDGVTPPDGMGYRVNVDKPGYHGTARLHPEAPPQMWAEQLARLCRRD
jgi:hypothetical protein